MTKYYMTRSNNSEDTFWEPCKTKTLHGAKIEASKRYTGNMPDDLLEICTGDNMTVQRTIIARKTIRKNKWRTPCP